jgi:hypothetical protein
MYGSMATPRVFHFIFGLKEQQEAFHLAHFLCLQSCLLVNSPAVVKVHYRHEPWGPLWNRIKTQITLCYLEEPLPLSGYAYSEGNSSAEYRYAHSSDFLRVDILRREGGVYADMDTLFVRPYPQEMYEWPFVMGHETVDPFVKHAHIGGSLCNALFLSQAGSEFARLWQEKMESAFDGTWSRHSTFLPFEISQAHPDLVHLEPTTSFFHLDWTRDGLRDLFERDVVLPPTVYSLHLWAHLWWKKDRTDVSRFHAGRLTAQYVAHADTTYARYARPFLPQDLATGSEWSWALHRTGNAMHDAISEIATRVRSRLIAVLRP